MSVYCAPMSSVLQWSHRRCLQCQFLQSSRRHCTSLIQHGMLPLHVLTQCDTVPYMCRYNWHASVTVSKHEWTSFVTLCQILKSLKNFYLTHCGTWSSVAFWNSYTSVSVVSTHLPLKKLEFRIHVLLCTLMYSHVSLKNLTHTPTPTRPLLTFLTCMFVCLKILFYNQ
jgi:hypothetical protein